MVNAETDYILCERGLERYVKGLSAEYPLATTDPKLALGFKTSYDARWIANKYNYINFIIKRRTTVTTIEDVDG